MGNFPFGHRKVLQLKATHWLFAKVLSLDPGPAAPTDRPGIPPSGIDRVGADMRILGEENEKSVSRTGLRPGRLIWRLAVLDSPCRVSAGKEVQAQESVERGDSNGDSESKNS